MAPRANWKGYLKLSLVSCKVALFPATSTSSRVRFYIINRETGNRVHNQVVDAETGDPVEDEDRVKGYREGNRYVLLEEDELDRVALESTHTIDIEAFVPRAEVDELYLDESYYLVPDEKAGAEAYAVIREAMAKEDLVGVARAVLYRRERLLMLSPRGKGLMATTLRYKNEVRDEKTYLGDIPKTKIEPDMLDLAVHILKTKHTKFDPSKFEDRYDQALRDLIKAKRKGKPLPEPEREEPSNVINLMDALRKSVQGERRGKSSAGKSSEDKTPKRKPAARKSSSRKSSPQMSTRAKRSTRRLKKAS